MNNELLWKIQSDFRTLSIPPETSQEALGIFAFLSYVLDLEPLEMDADSLHEEWFKSPVTCEGIIRRFKNDILSHRIISPLVQRLAETVVYFLDRLAEISADYRDSGLSLKLCELRRFYDCALLRNLAISYFKYGSKPLCDLITPDSVAVLASKLIDAQDGLSVADLCCGYGGFLSQMGGTMAFGYDIHSEVRYYATALCALYNSYPTVETKDVFELSGLKFDRIFCAYPWGATLPYPTKYLQSQRWKPLSVMDVKRSTLSWLFVAKALSLLKDNGIAVVHMNEGALYSTYEDAVRRQALEKGLVRAVISLPAKIMHRTGINSSLVVFSYGNTEVRFVDASGLGEMNRSKVVQFDEDTINIILKAVAGELTDLPTRTLSNKELLAQKEIKLSSHILMVEQPDDIVVPDGVVLKNLVYTVNRGASISQAYLTDNPKTGIRVLTASDIVDGYVDVKKLQYLSLLGEEELTGKAMTSYLIDGDVVLTNKSTVIKSAAIETAGENIILSGSLYGLRIKQDLIKPLFLSTFFNSGLGQQVLEKTQTGTAISIITVANLLDMEVPCPSTSQQKHLVDKALLLRRELQAAIERIEKLRASYLGLFDIEGGPFVASSSSNIREEEK